MVNYFSKPTKINLTSGRIKPTGSYNPSTNTYTSPSGETQSRAPGYVPVGTTIIGTGGGSSSKNKKNKLLPTSSNSTVLTPVSQTQVVEMAKDNLFKPVPTLSQSVSGKTTSSVVSRNPFSNALTTKFSASKTGLPNQTQTGNPRNSYDPTTNIYTDSRGVGYSTNNKPTTITFKRAPKPQPQIVTQAEYDFIVKAENMNAISNLNTQSIPLDVGFFGKPVEYGETNDLPYKGELNRIDYTFIKPNQDMNVSRDYFKKDFVINEKLKRSPTTTPGNEIDIESTWKDWTVGIATSSFSKNKKGKIVYFNPIMAGTKGLTSISEPLMQTGEWYRTKGQIEGYTQSMGRSKKSAFAELGLTAGTGFASMHTGMAGFMTKPVNKPGEFITKDIPRIPKGTVEFGKMLYTDLKQNPGFALGEFAGLYVSGKTFGEPLSKNIIKPVGEGALAQLYRLHPKFKPTVEDPYGILKTQEIPGVKDQKINVDWTPPRGLEPKISNVDPSKALVFYDKYILDAMLDKPVKPKLTDARLNKIVDSLRGSKTEALSGSYIQSALLKKEFTRDIADLDIGSKNREATINKITKVLGEKNIRILRQPHALTIVWKKTGQHLADIVEYEQAEGGYGVKYPITRVDGIPMFDIRARFGGKNIALTKGYNLEKTTGDIESITGKQLSLTGSQVTGAFGKSFQEQSQTIGKTMNIGTAQPNMLAEFLGITLEKEKKLGVGREDLSFREKVFYGTPADVKSGATQIRTSRLGTMEADLGSTSSLLSDLVSGNKITFQSTKPQAYIFEKSKIPEIPDYLKKDYEKALKGTVADQFNFLKKYQAEQLKPTGEFRAFGNPGGELELVAGVSKDVHNVLKVNKKIAVTTINGKRVKIFSAELVPDNFKESATKKASSIVDEMVSKEKPKSMFTLYDKKNGISFDLKDYEKRFKNIELGREFADFKADKEYIESISKTRKDMFGGDLGEITKQEVIKFNNKIGKTGMKDISKKISEPRVKEKVRDNGLTKSQEEFLKANNTLDLYKDIKKSERLSGKKYYNPYKISGELVHSGLKLSGLSKNKSTSNNFISKNIQSNNLMSKDVLSKSVNYKPSINYKPTVSINYKPSGVSRSVGYSGSSNFKYGTSINTPPYPGKSPPSPTIIVPGINPPPVNNRSYPTDKKKKSQESSAQAFTVDIRRGDRKGDKYVRVPLTEKPNFYRAVDIGARIADKYSNRTFRVRESSGKANTFLNSMPPIINKFRYPKSNKLSGNRVFVEKSKFAIDNYNERQEIPYEAQRLRAAGLINTKKSKINFKWGK